MVNAIEYYNASLNHFFLTADSVTSAILAANVMFPEWQRTGVEFGVAPGQLQEVLTNLDRFATSDPGFLM